MADSNGSSRADLRSDSSGLENFGAHPKKSRDSDINGVFTKYQLGLDDWKVAGTWDLRQELQRAMRWVHLLRADELIPTRWKGTSIDLPEHVRITFEPRPANELGYYIRGRAWRDGTRWNININPVSIIVLKRSAAQSCAVLAHELFHLCEDEYRQKVGKSPAKTPGYHSADFRRRVERIGIPCTAFGAEQGIVPGSPFDKWLARHSIPREFECATGEGEQEELIRLPKRVLWKCGCADAVKVMVPRASSIRFVCQVCSCPVRPVTR